MKTTDQFTIHRSLTWIAQPLRGGRFCYYYATAEGIQYWVKRVGGKWHVADSHGGAWGRFDTSAEAMVAVENL